MDDILPNLISAIKAILDSGTSQAVRNEAFTFYEQCKDSAHCAQCGLELSKKDYDSVVRHIGLQLTEHAIKFKWVYMAAEEKVNVKESVLQLMHSGTKDILTEDGHIKEGLCKVMVEIIKREWPQQYTTLLTELGQLIAAGPVQTELVMRTLKRLLEDMLTFHNVPSTRRRDIMTGLNKNMAELFTIFSNFTEKSLQPYQNMVSGSTEQLIAARVIESTLETMAVYLEWVTPVCIFYNEGTLLQTLSSLLQDPLLQGAASECLLTVASRKFKTEDRKKMVFMFEEQTVGCIFQAAVKASQAGLGTQHFLFMKKLSQLLAQLGLQLITLWDQRINGSPAIPPSIFANFLAAVMAFTEHPSQSLSSVTLPLWLALLRDELISKDQVLLSTFVPKLLQAATKTLLKVGYPSQNNSPCCEYSRLEFDSDEDFFPFYTRYRLTQADTLRLCAVTCPRESFTISQSWLQQQLAAPLDLGANNTSGLCNQHSPSYIQWDALTLYTECVVNKLQLERYAAEGVEMLKAAIHYQCKDPLIVSTVLSVISSLFPFIRFEPSVLPILLEKIFSAAVFNPDGETKSTRNRAVRNVRRHACSVLVKVCKQYPHLLFPGFEQLYQHIQQLIDDPDQLSQMEKITLMEALMLVSNEFKDYKKMSDFLGKILQPVKQIWLSDNIKKAIWDPSNLMTFVGLDQAPVEPSSADTCGINRSEIMLCLHFLYGLRRCEPPSDHAVAQQGGFVETLPTGEEVVNNPAAQHVLGMLDNLVALIRTHNALLAPQMLQKRHKEFENAYGLTESEKQTILAGNLPVMSESSLSKIHKDPLTRMQLFIVQSHDLCYHVLGSVCQTMPTEFYKTQGLADLLITYALDNIDQILDYRLKVIIRAFMKPFALHCPVKSYESVLLPVLLHFCPPLLKRLNTRWQHVYQQSCEANGTDEEEDTEVEEVIKDQLLRQASHEYLELIYLMLKHHPGTPHAPQGSGADDSMGQVEEQEEAPQNQSMVTLGELGQLLLSKEGICPCVVMTVFSAITWPDTASCNKSCTIALPVLKKLMSESRLTSNDAGCMYTAVLQGLQVQGQHEGQQAMLILLGLQFYELLRPLYMELEQVMLQIPGINEESLKSFNEKILNPDPQKAITEKRKKDQYKKLIEEIIGKNVGQRFRSEVKFNNLQPIPKINRRAARDFFSDSSTDVGICSLFSPDNDTDP